MAADPNDPYDLGIVKPDQETLNLRPMYNPFLTMQSTSSVTSSSVNSTPTIQLSQTPKSEYKQTREHRDKINRKNYWKKIENDNKCRFEKEKQQQVNKPDERTELKAVTKKEPIKANYFVHEDEINFQFRYRSKAELNSFMKRAYEVASFLSYAGILSTFTDAVERAGLDDVFANSCLVGSVNYLSEGKSVEIKTEKRATNLLECDLSVESANLYDFLITEITPVKFEGRVSFWDQRKKEIMPYIKTVMDGKVGEFIGKDMNVRQERLMLYMCANTFKFHNSKEHLASTKLSLLVLEYLGEDDCMDSLADGVLACFNNFKTELHVRHATISMALFYNLKQQFLVPNVQESTLLKNVVDVAVRWGAANIPVDSGNIAYETALYTYWFILHKLSTEFRFTQVQTDKFVDRLNIQSP